MRHYQAAEENNHADNEEVDMQVDKLRSNGKKEKEKVHVSVGEWRMIMAAERAWSPPCVVLVINDNPYGLMFALSYICRTCP
jgi:hypothetical protein